MSDENSTMKVLTPEEIAAIVESAKKSTEPIVEKVKTRKEVLLEQISSILKEHDGLEPNIGLSHSYWSLVEEYRSIK